MHQPLSQWLQQLLQLQTSHEIKVISQLDTGLITQKLTLRPDQISTPRQWLAHSQQRYELVLICHGLAGLTQTTCEHLLAGLRDQYAQHVFIAEKPQQLPLQRNQIYALGFGGIPGIDQQPLHDDFFTQADHSTQPSNLILYEYNILSYKKIPDWLNAKNWANPELWDQYRW